jgi:predicted Zn-ribbon and HTH transcriptional regulator
MKIPSWEEVNIPRLVVSQVKQLKPSAIADALVHQLVYHNTKKLCVSYPCDSCGHIHSPTKATDEVSQCPACQSKRVRCVQSLKFTSGTKLPLYTRRGSYLANLLRQMTVNFNQYFLNKVTTPYDDLLDDEGDFGIVKMKTETEQEPAERNMNWEWHDGEFVVWFAGGEAASDELPRMAIAKAALLCPYLWDMNYDWKERKRSDKVDDRFIVPLLSHLLPRN